MSIEMAFAHNGEQYALMHISSNDSRVVISEETGEAVLTFDSSLNIRHSKWGDQGWLEVGRHGSWTLVNRDGPTTIDLGVPSNNYGWREIVAAEVEAAKVLLQ